MIDISLTKNNNLVGKIPSSDGLLGNRQGYNFMDNTWFSPNTYNTDFDYPPELPGVYVIKEYSLYPLTKEGIIVYVGSSKNLHSRYHGHPVLKSLRQNNPDKAYAFYFKVVEYGFYDLEIALIKKLKPKLNIQHNG